MIVKKPVHILALTQLCIHLVEQLEKHQDILPHDCQTVAAHIQLGCILMSL